MNEKTNKYLIQLASFSIPLFFILGYILHTNQPLTDFLLTVLVVHLIIKYTNELESK